MTVQPIVEGHGDVEAVPIVLRRIADALGGWIEVRKPIRTPRSRLSRPGELERVVALGARQLPGQGAVLVLVDADTDCPVQLASDWRLRAQAISAPAVVKVVLATGDFEAWFLAAVESLRGKRGIQAAATSPAKPEAIRGAKEHLQRLMDPGHYYTETLDQPALAAQFDLEAARRRCRSFRKLWEDVASLIDR